MKKLIILAGILVAAGYVATHYFHFVGPTVTRDAKIANEIVK